MSHIKLTREMLNQVAGLPSRAAREKLLKDYGLSVGKTTINKAREDLRNGTFHSATNGTVDITVAAPEVPSDETTIQEALRVRGIDPGAHNVSYGFSEWVQANGQVAKSLKIRATPKANATDRTAEVDGLEILTKLRDGIEPDPDLWPSRGDSAFVFSLNDTQFGKAEGGGTRATLERLRVAVQGAKTRIEELRTIGRDLGQLVLIGGGDIVEGCVIYPNQSFNIDMTRKAQIETAVGAILYVLDELAPLFERVLVLACKGNHGQNRVNGHRTDDSDNDDTLVFEMARLATTRDPALAHVEYTIATDEVGVTANVCGWTIGTTHGDVLGRGKNVFSKVYDWYRSQRAGRRPMGDCDLLVTHHYHHDQEADFGGWKWIQTRALDGGSKWFEDYSGMWSEPGVLSFVVTPDRVLQDKLYL